MIRLAASENESEQYRPVGTLLKTAMDPSERFPSTPSRFLADVMLGKLARWLRMLGYDTAYDRDAANE